jgi:hypothetical protein
VHTENSDRFENAEVTIIREMTVASTMNSLLVALFAFGTNWQFFRRPRRLRLGRSDRLLWAWLSRWFPEWLQCLCIVQLFNRQK